MPADASRRTPRVTARLRQGETVMPLELFFDLVFVLALTQCTQLMADDPSWDGMARGMLVLGALWWSWIGYAWLTSVIDPEEGAVRIAMFVVMAAFLVAAICVPTAFDDAGWVFAGAYGVVRAGHIFLFYVASRDDPELRKSVSGLAVSTAIGTGLIFGAAAADGTLQGVLFGVAIALDVAGPYFFGSEGWKLSPGHFAERHQLIVIVALGESFVAIGAGVEGDIDTGVVVCACLGMAVSAAMWWLYFDVAALATERQLAGMEAGRERNELARDSYSLLHFPLVAGIVLVALGMKKTIGHYDEALKDVPLFALTAGAAVYLFGHVVRRMRHGHGISPHRLVVGAVLLALYPILREAHPDAVYSLGIVALLLVLLTAYEAIRFAETRERTRHELNHHAVS